MHLLRAALALIMFTTAFEAAGQVLTSEMPKAFYQYQNSLSTKTTANACSTMVTVSDSLMCNPSLIGLFDKDRFAAQVYVGNDYASINNVNKILNQTITKEALREMFTTNAIIETEASGEMSFQTKYFGARFVPYRVTFFSALRNAAYPTLALHAMQERSFSFQGGSKLFDNLHGGVELRIADRKFVHREVTLYEISAEDGADLLKPQEQKAIYVEPGLTYFFQIPWKPRVSILGRNLGTVDKQHEALRFSPQLEGGVGIAPPIRYGTLEVGVDVRRDLEDDIISAQVGTSYVLGAMQLLAGIGNQFLSGGVIFGYGSTRVGIAYSSTRIPGVDENSYVQKVTTQFSFQL
jgi:hypothetical protein